MKRIDPAGEFTDEALRAKIEMYRTMPVPVAQYEYLLDVDASPEVRLALYREAGTMQNFTGDIFSGCLWNAIKTWRASGRFPYGEQAAQMREAERVRYGG